MHVQVEGGTLMAKDIQQAVQVICSVFLCVDTNHVTCTISFSSFMIQEGTEVYADAGFAEVSSQLFIPLATESSDTKGLTGEGIAGIVAALAIAAIIIVAVLMVIIVW